MGPIIPGTRGVRFVEPGPRVFGFQALLRERIQEGAPGLYVFEVPMKTMSGTPVFSVVEAYYPEGIRWEYAHNLDPYRMQDYEQGNLVCVGTVPLQGSIRLRHPPVNIMYNLDERHVLELRQNNRAARLNLKRKSSAFDRAIEMRNLNKKDEDRAMADFVDFYEDAVIQTREHAMGKPRVSLYNPTRR